MARIAGVDIPNEKRIDISLRYIYGIGPTSATRICDQSGIAGATKTRDLTDAELTRIRELLEKEFVIEGDLRRDIRQNVQRLIEINCYRGIRHRRGLPVRGQRTKTNARTKRGARRTVAGKRKAAAKK
jgi:small subunit ribosomal protein S13